MADAWKRIDEYMNRAIENSRQNVDHTIDAINRNYVNFLKEDMAEKSGDLTSVMHHQVMIETYQSMLEIPVALAYSGSPLQ